MDALDGGTVDHAIKLWQLVLAAIGGPAAAVVVQFLDGRKKNQMIERLFSHQAEIAKELAKTNHLLTSAAMQHPPKE